MQKAFNIFICAIALGSGLCVQQAHSKASLNNESSISLVEQAWTALKNDDLVSVLRLTDQCIDRYGARARQMQSEMNDFVLGTKAMIQSKWALNDVATALYIQGKALQNAQRYKEARAVYQRLVNEFTFGQCWDPKGWFWKPSVVAAENIAMIDNGVFYDFGDYTSTTLVTRAWEALKEDHFDLVIGYTDKCIELYASKAHELQSQLHAYPVGSDEELFGYWALNDLATAHFIRGRAFMIEGKMQEAIKEFEIVRDDYSYGQCWDPRGWWWKPAVEAQNWLDALKGAPEKSR